MKTNSSFCEINKYVSGDLPRKGREAVQQQVGPSGADRLGKAGCHCIAGRGQRLRRQPDCRFGDVEPRQLQRLPPGQSASVRISLDQIENAIVIPSISSVKEMGRDIAYVYEDGYAREVEIVTGMRTSASVEVISGLSIGDTLLTTGVMQLRTGMPVVIDRMVENRAN